MRTALGDVVADPRCGGKYVAEAASARKQAMGIKLVGNMPIVIAHFYPCF